MPDILPKDVAMMMEMLLGAGHVKLGDMDELLRKHLSRFHLYFIV